MSIIHPSSIIPSASSSTLVSDDRTNIGSTRSKLACAACRLNKVRCLRNEGLDHACMRCLRYGLACTPPAINKRRGRPRRESSNGNSLDNNTSPPHPLSSSFNTVQLPNVMPPLNMTNPSYSMNPVPDFSSQHHNSNPNHHNISLSPENRRGGNMDLNPARPYPLPHQSQSQSTHNHSHTKDAGDPFSYSVVQASPLSSAKEEAEGSGTNPNAKKDRNLDLSEYLDPADNDNDTGRPLQNDSNGGPNEPFFLNYATKTARFGEDEGNVHMESRDDPVHLMIISESEAAALVQLFHDRLNHLVAVLDYKLHTLAYLRNTSTILFSAVVAAASKFSRPDLHSSLLSHAQTLLSRAVNNGLADVGVVQTIMILMYWKLPADTSSWRKIGIAIRMGYQLYWHLPRNQPLPDDEMSARKILNAERTWMCLFCFDRSLSQTYGLPVAIQPNHMMDPGNWAREHTYIGPSVDVHLASSIELCKLKDQWRAICDSAFQSSAYNDAALDSVHAQCEALLGRYWRKDAPPMGFEYEKEHVGLWSTLDFMLTLKRHHLEASPNDPLRIDACLSYASRITDEIDAVANNGDLEIMQDTSSVMASSLTVLLRKIFHLSSITQKILIITLLQRILTAYTRASGTEINTAPAYVARFVQRTLRAIGMESKAGSPMRDQGGNGGNGTGINDNSLGVGSEQPDFMLQLQEFMMLPDETTITGINDEDYWSTLFSV